MNCLRDTILRHVRLTAYVGNFVLAQKGNLLKRSCWRMCTSTAHSPDQMIDRVVGLVKKFDRIDSSKVTETADFQKDLSLDSLDKVELVMAFEQEFNIEIPEEAADKLTCCADVAKYMASMAEGKAAESS